MQSHNRWHVLSTGYYFVWFFFFCKTSRNRVGRCPLTRSSITPALQAISRWLPCPTCAQHVQTFLQETPRTSTWFSYMVDLHNDVNIRKGRPIGSIDFVRHIYQYDYSHHPEAVYDRVWEMIWILIASYDLYVTSATRDTYLTALQALVDWMDTTYRIPRTNTSVIVAWSQQFWSDRRQHAPLRWWFAKPRPYTRISEVDGCLPASSYISNRHLMYELAGDFT